MRRTQLFGRRPNKQRKERECRVLRLESLETRNLLAGDVGVKPPVADAGDAGSDVVVSKSRSRQMRSDSRAESQLSRLAFRKPAMLAVA